jgi:putative nucleotidyltransferase with HDIG domain
MGGIGADQMEGIRTAAILHDIGKLYVPFELLNKPDRLSDIEFALIKSHPQAGYNILKDIEFPWSVARIVQQHHERLDGSGYPAGLQYDNILLEARIIGVADVVEAMSSHRPYRPSKGMESALEKIAKGRGTHYDPHVVDICLDLFRKGFKI